MSKFREFQDHLAKVAIDTEHAPRPKRDKLPDPASEEIYDWVDKHLAKLSKDHPELPLKNIAAKDLGVQAEEKLLAGLKAEIDEYFSLNPTPLGYAEATVAVETIVNNWIKTSTGDVDDYIGTLMGLGYLAGLESSDIPDITVNDLEVVRQISADPKRIGNSIITFSRGIVNDFRSIISDVYGPTGTHTVGDAVTMMQSRVNAERWKLERIVRTETAQSSGAGRFMGWGRDTEKYYYEYLWLNPADNRSKEISVERVEGNPYTYDEVRFLWENQEQLVNGKWQNDVYHQRCSIARYPRNEEFSGNRFEGREDEFRRTAGTEFVYE